MPSHPPILVPTAETSSRAVLPDDPGVALTLATELLRKDRKMANHHRGLWGYVGTGRDGRGPLTIQSTGVGSGSASLVMGELLELGVTTAIRVGTARARHNDLPAGSLFAVTEAWAGELQANLDPALTAALTKAVDTGRPVHSIEPHEPANEVDLWDLETAAQARLAEAAGARYGALLVVSATPSESLGHEAVSAATAKAGAIAAAVLAVL